MTENKEIEEQESRILQKFVERVRLVPSKNWSFTEGKQSWKYASQDERFQYLLRKEEHEWSSTGQDSTDEWVTDDYKNTYYRLNVENENIGFLGEENYENGRLTGTSGPIDVLKGLFEFVDERVQTYEWNKRNKQFEKERIERERKDKLEIEKKKRHLSDLERRLK